MGGAGGGDNSMSMSLSGKVYVNMYDAVYLRVSGSRARFHVSGIYCIEGIALFRFIGREAIDTSGISPDGMDGGMMVSDVQRSV